MAQPEPTNVWGVDVAQVAGKIGYFDIGPSTEPDEDTVLEWIKDYAAELNAILVAVGITPSSVTDTTNPDGYRNVQGKLKARVAADVHMANQNGSTELADQYVEEWNAFLGRVRYNPKGVLGNVEDGFTPRAHSAQADYEERPTFWKRGMKL